MSDYELMSIPKQDHAAFLKMRRQASGSFIRRVKLMQGISAEVQQGTASPREFLLGDDKTNLGREFLAVIGPYRLHAIQFTDGKLEAESFDPNDPVFETIAGAAGKWAKGASCGPEFLLWVPEASAFATIHFVRGGLANGDEAVRRQGQLVKITSELTGNPKKRQWPVPVVAEVGDVDVSTLSVPSKEEFEAASNQFLAPTKERKVEDSGERPR